MASGEVEISFPDDPDAHEPAAPSPVSAYYADKTRDYFAGARHDIVALLPTDRESSILEIGCGSGGTARAVRAAGKAGRYVGIELFAEAAEAARDCLDTLIVGDVERIDLSAAGTGFDALIMSEVVEHFSDPWATIARLAPLLRPGAAVFASSPNVAHWQVIRDLLRGRFDYADAGVMDRTHLRWFTPAGYRALFEGAGFTVDVVRPISNPRWRARLIDRMSGGRLSHLFMMQMMVIGRRNETERA